MAVLQEYTSGNESYARSANAFLSGMSQGQSLMERKQAMAIKGQQADQQQAEFQAQLPAIQMKALADISSAKASVENATLIEKFRGQAAYESKGLNEEYLKAIQLPAFEDQARALSALQPRVAYMETLPEYKGFVTAVNNATVRAHNSAQIDRQLNNKLEQETLRQQYQSQIAQDRLEMTRTAMDARQKSAEDLAAAKAEAAQLKLENTSNVSYNKDRGVALAKHVSDVQSRAETAYGSLEHNDRIRKLIDSGANQGRGQETVLAIQTAVNSFIPGTFDTTKEEVLKQGYADIALQTSDRLRSQGSITENERRYAMDTVAKFGNTPQAAKAILDFIDAASRRDIARAHYYDELEADGKMVTSKVKNNFNDEHPIATYMASQTPKTSDTKVPLKVLGFVKQQ